MCSEGFKIRHFRIDQSTLKLYLLKFGAFYAGCLGSYLLQTRLGVTPIAASAFLGFAGTFMPLPERINRTGAQMAFYTGTFAAMCSRELMPGHLEILVVSLVGAGVYVALKQRLIGLGGKLGAIAFISCLLLYFAKVLS